MIRVCAPSRLHFGLLSLPGDESSSGRCFGGVGLMVRGPGLRLTARPAAIWSAEGPLAERALDFARRLAASWSGEAVPPQQLLVERAAAEHVGLGSGTQLALSVARVIQLVGGGQEIDATGLARWTGRGLRSGLGLYGFRQGGFLVDGGKHGPEAVAPLVARQAFPQTWRLVLVIPAGGQGLHGAAEVQAFRRLGNRPASGRTDSLCRLVLLGLLPALVESDLPAFGEALYEFNRRVGETFAVVQGSCYATAQVEDVVNYLRRQDVRGTGQSSWGPTVFALVEDEQRANALAQDLRQRYALNAAEVITTAACNRGAVTAEVADELADATTPALPDP
jgi:beta-RFAP synthase